jgi:ABC-type transport system involved in multi-copper enzyme maturation permease subunit
MKLWGIFRFELRYQLRRPWPWLIFAGVLVISFLMTRDAAVADAVFDDFFVNSPFHIAITTVVGGLVWLLAAAAIAGEAAARDVATGMYPLTYTAPVRKLEYLGGRFLAALALNALILLAVQAGAILAVYSPGVNPELIGPFRFAAYLTAYAYIALPNAFAATAIQFLLATRSGRPMASYGGSVLLVFMGFFVASLLLFSRGLGTLLDPIGIRFVVEDIAHLWTTTEKNTRLLGFEGVVLHNRLVWLTVAVAALLFTYLSFRFAHRTPGSWLPRWLRRRAAHSPLPAVTATAPISVPDVPRAFGFAVELRKTLAIAWDSFRSIARSWPGLAMLLGIPLLTVLVVLDQTFLAGVPLVPTTALVLRELTTSLSDEMSRWVIVPLITVFFAGELVWREREAGLSEIADTAPGSDWAPLAGKFIGLAYLLALFLVMLGLAGMLAQGQSPRRDQGRCRQRAPPEPLLVRCRAGRSAAERGPQPNPQRAGLARYNPREAGHRRDDRPAERRHVLSRSQHQQPSHERGRASGVHRPRPAPVVDLDRRRRDDPARRSGGRMTWLFLFKRNPGRELNRVGQRQRRELYKATHDKMRADLGLPPIKWAKR